MRIRIHRGTKEIGGTCIEVKAQGKRIAPGDGHESLLPRVRPGVQGNEEPPFRLDIGTKHRPLGDDFPRRQADRPRPLDRPLHRRRAGDDGAGITSRNPIWMA